MGTESGCSMFSVGSVPKPVNRFVATNFCSHDPHKASGFYLVLKQLLFEISFVCDREYAACAATVHSGAYVCRYVVRWTCQGEASSTGRLNRINVVGGSRRVLAELILPSGAYLLVAQYAPKSLEETVNGL